MMTTTDAESDLITKLAAAVASQVHPPIPLSVDLWDSETIGRYLKRSPSQVLERLACLPGFPTPIRLPSGEHGKGKGQPLWRATEIIAWAESHRNNIQGRPRKVHG